jgi:hypothetical protein
MISSFLQGTDDDWGEPKIAEFAGGAIALIGGGEAERCGTEEIMECLRDTEWG